MRGTVWLIFLLVYEDIMKTKGVLKWFVEWDRELRHYRVKKGGFSDSVHRNKIDALKRIIELEESEAKE